MSNFAGMSTAEMCRRTGATYRQLDYWARCGYVTPSIRAAAGTGNPRVWSPADVPAVIRLVVRSRDLRGGLVSR